LQVVRGQPDLVGERVHHLEDVGQFGHVPGLQVLDDLFGELGAQQVGQFVRGGRADHRLPALTTDEVGDPVPDQFADLQCGHSSRLVTMEEDDTQVGCVSRPDQVERAGRWRYGYGCAASTTTLRPTTVCGCWSTGCGRGG